MSSALMRQRAFKCTGVITARTIDWAARREAVEAAIAATAQQRSARMSWATVVHTNRSSVQDRSQVTCIICDAPFTRLFKPITNNPLELGLCISPTAYRQLEIIMAESDSETDVPTSGGSKKRGNIDLDPNEVWTMYIVEDRRYHEERFFRRHGFNIKMHIVPNSALWTTSALHLPSLSNEGQTTSTIQRQRDIWPCISPKDARTEGDWNRLRRSCLEGKEVRCLILDSQRTFSMEAVMRALGNVDKYDVKKRRTARLWNGESEIESGTEVILCTVEEEKVQADKEVNMKSQEGQSGKQSRFEWKKKLEGEYKERAELKWRRVADAVAGTARVASFYMRNGNN